LENLFFAWKEFRTRQKECLEYLLAQIEVFLKNNLKLDLHPNKIFLQKWHNGIDWLGYIVFPHHTILRTKTKRRMLKKVKAKKIELKRGKISAKSFNQSLQSYFGVLKHCCGWELGKECRGHNGAGYRYEAEYSVIIIT
jgi:hypothetical protein